MTIPRRNQGEIKGLLRKNLGDSQEEFGTFHGSGDSQGELWRNLGAMSHIV